ncbi:amino acid ABC transporter permease/ATP-binding protein [Ignatzschineria larvae DSM 13226]|uniref:Amino acid ABC transporter permease/ATP-binding protein n=1 Tax=Ignatzschineria larvae DSM 13226 TaxID=1111732 RepID=A0ABZ3C1P3_9GAMM|nr:amino acid ABC transporter permease/ATP-binding protein [Ignatzschineria larvae]
MAAVKEIDERIPLVKEQYKVDHNYKNYKVIPARYPMRNVGSIIAAFIITLVLYSILTNPRWGWDIFGEWLFSEPVMVGLSRTILLTIIGTILGSLLGMLLALARVSKSPLLSGASWTYIWFLRSIPLIVILLLLNNIGYLYESIKVSNPFTGEALLEYPIVTLITPFTAAVIGLTLNQSAFFAEIIRGGILSVDNGQHEAASALGISKKRQSLRIVLPQAMRTILPTGFNEIIGLAKGTSMLYVLALPELFYTVQVIYRRNLEVIPLLMVATMWYLVIMTVLSIIQHYVERYYARGAVRNPVMIPFQKQIGNIKSFLLGQPSRVSLDLKFSRKIAIQTSTSVDPIILESKQTEGAAIQIDNVSKSFGKNRVLNDISLFFPAGSVTAILGPSGSGKSTLLRTINHLESVDEGFITVDGELIGYLQKDNKLYELKEKDILKQRADIAMVFQNFNLFPHMTVLENIIEAPIQVKDMKYEEAVDIAFDLLLRVGLLDKADSYPRQLSGGQQQRIAIARALALNPKVILFDEPTSALDPELVGEVLDIIKNLAHSGTTLVVVTHEMNFAYEVADTIIFMEEGNVIEQGSVDNVFNHTQHPRTKAFLNKII